MTSFFKKIKSSWSFYFALMKFLSLIFILPLLSIFASAQPNSLYQKKIFIRNGDTLRYRILYPLNYNQKKSYPLVLFLHGKGERGRDNEKQLIHGGSLFTDSVNRKNFPAIVIFPQCTPEDYWAQMKMLQDRTDSTPEKVEYLKDVPPGKSLNLVMMLLDSMATGNHVNQKRIYVMGLSMGGRGTFEILWRKPNFFAAAIAVAGGGNVETVSLYAKNFPIWVFHGSADKVVNVNDSRRMVTALKSAGAKVKYTEYPGIDHNSWDNAFAEKDLLPWLYSQKKK